MKNFPPVVKNLLIINCLVFVAQQILPASALHFPLQGWISLHYVGTPYFRLWQLFTYMFAHAGIDHLFFNMFALWMFGRILENVWGSKRFLFYYMVCGVGAGLTQELLQLAGVIPPVPVVGASGAVYGLLLAFGVMFPNMPLFIIPIPVPIKAKWMVIGYTVIELLEGIFSYGNVAHFAHLGGMVFGLMLILYWRRHNKDTNGWTYR